MSGPASFFPTHPDLGRPGPAQAWQVRPYTQLLRGPNHAWFRPLLSALVVLVGLALLTGLFSVGLWVVMTAGGPASPEAMSQEQLDAWQSSPGGLLVVNLSLAALIPVTMVAVWLVHGWRPRWLGSVSGGIRWPLLLRSALLALLVLVVLNGVLVALSGGVGAVDPQRQLGLYVLIVLLTTPLQAAGEEYLFRGWLSQAVGSWFARAGLGAVVAALVSGLLFALAHGQQDPWLFADRFAFGLISSWLVWRTGGLEASIGLHVAFNLLALGVALLTGHLDTTLAATRADPLMVASDVVMMVVAALALDRLARRSGALNRFRPPGAG